MMIINRKQDALLPKKPNRFNLGGLIKKKITWKRSIDSLAANLDHVNITYDNPSDHSLLDLGAATFAASYSASSYSDSSYNNSLAVPLLKTYTHTYHTQDHYASFTTECISLLNSDMTSHMDFDDDHKPAPDPDTAHVAFEASAEESAHDYRMGGYHPVKIGDVFDSDVARYRVLRKLGWGHFSTVWLCVCLDSGDHVAIKIVKLGNNYSEAARDEIRILKVLQEQDDEDFGLCVGDLPSNVVRLLDDFRIAGQNGTHIAMVFELMGENMLHLIYKHKAEKYAARSLKRTTPAHLLLFDTVKLIVLQVLSTVNHMHHRGVIHTDLKPENILLAYNGVVSDEVRNWKPNAHFQILPSQPMSARALEKDDFKVKVADLGNATYANLHFTNHIQTRQYRAPEIILKHKTWGALADVWSIGCLIFELITGDYLFDPHDGLSFDKDEDHLAQIIELLGEFPSEKYLSNCELAGKFFSSPTSMMTIASLKFWSLEKVLEEKYKYDPNDDNVKLACDLIRKCLKYNLDERYDCESLLAHPWFREGATFDQRECDELPNGNANIAGFTCEE